MSQKNSQLIKILEKFPDQNPNPVLRFSEQGALMYYNESSKNIVDEWRIKLNEKPPIASNTVHCLKVPRFSLTLSE